jgi:hypothetical protein
MQRFLLQSLTTCFVLLLSADIAAGAPVLVESYDGMNHHGGGLIIGTGLHSSHSVGVQWKIDQSGQFLVGSVRLGISGPIDLSPIDATAFTLYLRGDANDYPGDVIRSLTLDQADLNGSISQFYSADFAFSPRISVAGQVGYWLTLEPNRELPIPVNSSSYGFGWHWTGSGPRDAPDGLTARRSGEPGAIPTEPWFTHTRNFSYQVFGVPEPNSTLLFVVGIAALCQHRRPHRS